MSEIKMLGMLEIKGKEQIRRVYDPSGIAPTLTAVQGGWHHAKILTGGEKMKTLRVNDLFCGAGGMGLGFKNAGWEIAGAWDFDKYAVQSYAHNVGDHVKQADITQMTFEDMPIADCWTFGFPCQDLSVAGKQAGLFEGKRSGLFFEVMRLLDETIENDIDRLPKVIMAENVKGLKPYLEVLKDEYEKRGYAMYYTLYNSKFWGVAQNRERYFVVGVHESIDKEFNFPIQQEDYIPRLSTVLEPIVDDKYYIDDLKAAKIIEQAKEGLKVRQATKKGYDVAVEGDSINISHPNSKTRRGRVGKQVAQTLLTGQEQIVVAQPKINVVGNLKPEHCTRHGQRDDVWGSDGIAGTVCATDYKQPRPILHDYKVRKLLPREYARLQGFPESFEIVVSDTQAYKQFGNAVTVNVAQVIAERIKMFLLSL